MEEASLELEKERAKAEIKKLVEAYNQAKLSGQIKDYNEENTKRVFITRLFKALGWDTDTLDEVSNEDRISKGRVDYAFRINGIPKFYLEAKALNKGIEEAKDARQAINYAWYKDVTWAVLTDFASLMVYNAEVKGINEARFIWRGCNQFIECFDDLWLLSKPAFMQGLLDKKAESWGKKRTKIKPTEQLLEDITSFRKSLSQNIKKNNMKLNLSQLDIDEAVQKILDRLIFIRAMEDRKFEERRLLPAVREFEQRKRGKLTDALNIIYRRYDDKFDSKLFTQNRDNSKERHLCEEVLIDDEVLADIIRGLHESKDGLVIYDFELIDEDILGSMYEQYLAHILHTTEKRAQLEHKVAHRKEQGIYYTPPYIVDYIVKNTLGECIKGKSPSEISSIRVLDPACGSGSFLTKAFKYLEAYQKQNNPSYASSYLDAHTGSSKITPHGKILQENIFGVDLDPRAVEIAQLSLLISAADDKGRLPTLEENIKNGNSLIDDATVSDKAFKWEKEYSEIMKEGGFDVVVGNPPYVRNRDLEEKDKLYFENIYASSEGQYDIYQLFFEKSIELLKEGGLLGFITSNKYAITGYGKKLRKYILDTCQIVQIIDVSNINIFKDASTYPYIIILRKTSSEKAKGNNIIRTFRANSDLELAHPFYQKFNQSDFLSNDDFAFTVNSDEDATSILSKISSKCKKLGEIATIKETVHTGNVRDKLVVSRCVDSSYKKLLRGKDCQRYFYNWNGLWLLADPNQIHKNKGEYATIPDKKYFEQPKLFLREIAEKLTACYDEEGFYSLNKAYVIVLNDKAYSLKYVLGLLNSKLLSWFFRKKFESAHVRGGHLQFKKQYTSQLPVRVAGEIEAKQITDAVEHILSLTKKLQELGNKHTSESEKLEKEIQETDEKIDELVYDLYGLTKEEIKIVEDSFKKN